MSRSFVARRRIALSRAFGAALVVVLLACEPSLPSRVPLEALVGTGFALVTIAALGRLWCSVYLCGRKTREVVDVGPFSLVRNPLYLFSLTGSVGVGLATGSVTVLALLIGFFALVYPHVIADEERRLERRLGAEYLAYKARVPRLVPDFGLWRRPDAWVVDLRGLHSAFADVVWFFVAFGIVYALPALKAAVGGWPTLAAPG